jgi:lysophospholipase L1-like esterase
MMRARDTARAFRRSAIPALAILLPLALIEGAARLGERASPPPLAPTVGNGILVTDPVFHHRWQAHLSVRSDYRSVPYVVYTNGQRWVEAREVPEVKPRGTYRIFYVGDSSTEGVVMAEHKMVRLVERKLNAALGGRPHVETINTGTSSWSIFQYYLLSRYVLPGFSPDLVVFDVDMTDVSNDAFYRRLARFDENGDPVAVDPSATDRTGRAYRLTPFGAVAITPLERFGIGFHDRLATFRWMERGLARVRPPEPLVDPQTEAAGGDANWLEAEWTSGTQASVRYSTDLLGKAIDLLRARGIKVLVTGVPSYPQYTGDWSAAPHRALEEMAVRHGALFLDSFRALQPAIHGTPQTAYYWDNDPTHFNVEGNALWAEAQIDVLLAHRAQLGLGQ